MEEKPAIKRLDLSEIYLNLSMLGKDTEQLIWLDDPSEQSLLLAKTSLCSIGALNTNYKITEKGRKICQFPLRPRLGMALLLAKELNCLPAFSLALALVEDRSPIIHREFNRQVLESFCSTISGKEMGSTLKSDLSMLLEGDLARHFSGCPSAVSFQIAGFRPRSASASGQRGRGSVAGNNQAQASL